MTTTVSADGEIVAASVDYLDCFVMATINQSRMRSAVNACAGISSELLDAGYISDLQAAVRECFRRHGPLDTPACERVAKAMGVE